MKPGGRIPGRRLRGHSILSIPFPLPVFKGKVSHSKCASRPVSDSHLCGPWLDLSLFWRWCSCFLPPHSTGLTSNFLGFWHFAPSHWPHVHSDPSRRAILSSESPARVDLEKQRTTYMFTLPSWGCYILFWLFSFGRLEAWKSWRLLYATAHPQNRPALSLQWECLQM